MSYLTAGQLAQFRGCVPWNECYSECVQTAQYHIDEGDDPQELADAAEWAARQNWVN